MLAHLTTFLSKLHLSIPAVASLAFAVGYGLTGDYGKAGTALLTALGLLGVHFEIQQTAK